MTPEEIELRRRMADELTAARALHETSTRENRDLTEAEQATYDQHMTAARGIQSRVTRGTDLGGFPDPTAGATGDDGFGHPAARVTDRPTMRSAVSELLESDDLARARSQGYRGGFALGSLEGVGLRAMMALVDNSGTSGGAFQNPMRVGGDFQTVPDRMLRLIDLIPHGQTGDNSVEYVRDTTTDALGNTAAETAEGGVGLKPETTSTFEVVTDPVKTIAAWLDVTRQSLDDNAQLRTNLEGRLLYRAWRRLDGQIINGDGVGANLLGLLNRPGILTYAPIAAERRIESVRRAVTVGEQSDVEYSAVVVNPLDKERYDMSFASGSGEFLSATAPAYMWGLRPVVSNAIAAGTALLVDPNEAMLWDREEPAIYVTDSDADKFRRNILTMLIDLRAALSLFTPRAALKLTFNGAT